MRNCLIDTSTLVELTLRYCESASISWSLYPEFSSALNLIVLEIIERFRNVKSRWRNTDPFIERAHAGEFMIRSSWSRVNEARAFPEWATIFMHYMRVAEFPKRKR